MVKRLSGRLIGGAAYNRAFASLLGVMLASSLQAQGRDADVPVVDTVTVNTGSIRQFEFAQGTVQALRREYLVFETSGKVGFIRTNADGFPAREGEPVTEGELLASLEHDTESASLESAQASLDAARAGLRSAQAAYDRAENLKAGGAISERDYERAVTSLEQSRARVESAETALIRSNASMSGAQLVAPFDGVLAFVNIREGQYISPASFNSSSEEAALRTAPMVLIDPRSFEIIVDVPSFAGDRLAADQPAFVIRQESLASLQTVGVESPDQLVRELVPAKIFSVSPAINPEDRSIRTRIMIQDAEPGLRDGEHVTVWLQVGRKDGATVIPTNAVVRRDGQPFVYVVDTSGRAQRREVTLGLIGLEGIEVLSGVAPGESVITRGKSRAREGELVTVARAERASP